MASVRVLESLLIASKHQLDNLIIIIDYNKLQAPQPLRTHCL